MTRTCCRHWAAIQARVASVVVMLVASAIVAAAENPGADDPLAETPALPYLTMMVVRDPVVHAELRLSQRQIKDVQAAISAVDNPMWQLRDVPVAECADKLNGYLATLDKQLDQVLSKAQRDRLQSLILQARGAKGLLSPETAQRLELSDRQLAELRTQIADLMRERKKTGAGATSKDGQAKIEQGETNAVLSVLSSQQQQKLAKLLGKRFDLSRVRKIGCIAPELTDVDAWINSDPLTFQSLRGKVVVVHFWAFGCINCVHNLPHYQTWYERFPESEVTIIGIHTPETEPERNLENLRSKVAEYNIRYPVVFDRSAANWKLWGNRMWPSVYLVDRQGQVRSWWYGELNWQGANGEEAMRRQIEQLIAEK